MVGAQYARGLAGAVEEGTAGVDIEGARAGWDRVMAKETQSAICRDIITDDAIVTTVGGIAPLAVGVDFNVRGGASCMVCRKRGDVLEYFESAALLVVAVGGNGIALFIDDIGDVVGGTEADVAGSGLTSGRR